MQDKISLYCICPLCLNHLKNPVTLPCSHNFCMDCAEGILLLATYTSSEFRCPECKVLIGDTYSKSLFLKPFSVRACNGIEIVSKCRICKENSEFACIDCEVTFCAKCAEIHTMGKYRVHMVETIEDYREKYCIEHKMKKIAFCMNDLALMCMRCLTLHPSHNFLKLDQAEMEYQGKINETLERLNFFLSQLLNSNQPILVSHIRLLLSQQSRLKILQYTSSLDFHNASQVLPSTPLQLYYLKRNTEYIYSHVPHSKELWAIKTSQIFPKWSSFNLLPNGNFIIAGGKNLKTLGSKQDLLVLSPNFELIYETLMVHGHSSHPSLLHKDILYIIGGKDEDNITGAHCEALNINTYDIHLIPSMHHGRTCPAGVVQQDYIYIFGGYTSWISNSIEKYDILQNFWKELNVATPVRMFQAGAVVIDKAQILIFGGEISQDFNNPYSFVFNTESEKFGLTSKIGFKDTWFGCWCHSIYSDGFVYTLSSNTMLVYNTKSNYWCSSGALRIT